jgi:hypothetical protein
MSAHDPSPHATGYEDAITRRIAGLEARLAELEADLARERAQAAGLAADNAKLRGRAADAESVATASARTAWIAGLLGAAGVLVGLWFWLLAPLAHQALSHAAQATP